MRSNDVHGAGSSARRATDARPSRVAEGVRELTHGRANCYLLDEHGRVTIVAGAATADSAENLRSLDVLDSTLAGTVLPGHGDRWIGGIRSAVELALAAGAA